jgi:hypothetical protein
VTTTHKCPVCGQPATIEGARNSEGGIVAGTQHYRHPDGYVWGPVGPPHREATVGPRPERMTIDRDQANVTFLILAAGLVVYAWTYGDWRVAIIAIVLAFFTQLYRPGGSG